MSTDQPRRVSDGPPPVEAALWEHRCDDGVGGCTAISQAFLEWVVKLLHQVDGHLGLAVYRTPHEGWDMESKMYIGLLRIAAGEMDKAVNHAD